MASWWEDHDVWSAFGLFKQYEVRSTAYLGGWSGHAKHHSASNTVVFRKDGIAYRGFRDIFVIPWDQVTSIEVEGPDSASSRVTATRLATLGVFALAAKKKSASAAIVVEVSSGETAIFHSDKVAAGVVQTKLLPITARLSRAATPVQASPEGAGPPASVADELMKMAQLRDQGIITNEQFEAQKAKLLG
jgi:hypothetical protein